MARTLPGNERWFSIMRPARNQRYYLTADQIPGLTERVETLLESSHQSPTHC